MRNKRIIFSSANNIHYSLIAAVPVRAGVPGHVRPRRPGRLPVRHLPLRSRASGGLRSCSGLVTLLSCMRGRVLGESTYIHLLFVASVKQTKNPTYIFSSDSTCSHHLR